MSKRKKPTGEEELQDAIDRIGKNKEAQESTGNRRTWIDYLTNVLGVHEQAVNSEAGQKFWENVREGVIEQHGGYMPPPTQRRLDEANVQEESYQRSPTSIQIVYRSKETGRFVSRRSI